MPCSWPGHKTCGPRTETTQQSLVSCPQEKGWDAATTSTCPHLAGGPRPAPSQVEPCHSAVRDSSDPGLIPTDYGDTTTRQSSALRPRHGDASSPPPTPLQVGPPTCSAYKAEPAWPDRAPGAGQGHTPSTPPPPDDLGAALHFVSRERGLTEEGLQAAGSHCWSVPWGEPRRDWGELGGMVLAAGL